jgi:hypothetical protein
MLNQSPKMLKQLAMKVALVAITCVGMTFAQTTSTPPTSPATGPATPVTSTPMNPAATPPTTGERNAMENYLTNDPKVMNELHNNPSLINDPAWLAQHPKVQNYLNAHPNIKADAAANPAGFVNHTEQETRNTDRTALSNTDAYLARHPGVAKELSNNPHLIDDPKYLADHPDLQTYLNNHPGVKREWQDHPEYFAKAAKNNEERIQKYKQQQQAAAHPKPNAKAQ